MPGRVLFIASLHHPEILLRERDARHDQLFPSSMGQHFWERAFRAAGYEVAVFWRNLPGFGSRDIGRLSTAVYRNRWTPARVASALLRRAPPRWQPDLRRRNKLLLQAAKRFQPDIVWLSGDNREILPETLARLKHEHDCALIYVSGVSPIVFSHANEARCRPPL